MTFASIKETRALAKQANAAGPFQTVIHNAGIFRPNAPRLETVDDSKTLLQSMPSLRTC